LITRVIASLFNLTFQRSVQKSFFTGKLTVSKNKLDRLFLPGACTIKPLRS
jgi:hypothetical protein